ncbi:hypothetical protein NQ318_008439 [Aromia moschata]|uniref:RNase H type-1 domain-containing protein n=1 Tax=Aromia moschata TaxID=1265417 RepID=A0AAV8Y930_9CUCU|nr:hypothetical protein NQ318_008439 [Aromia moschata]
MRTAPSRTTEVLTGLRPLHLVIEHEAMRSAYRLTGLGHWIGEEQTTGHATIWNKATKNCPVLLMLQDSVEPTICSSTKLGIHIPSRDDFDNINNIICQNGIIWFTDGSKIGDKAGAGGQNYLLPSGHMLRRMILICTDSQAALMAIESSKVKSRLVLDCKKILNDLASCNRVILTWVPGHSGVPGNEEADRLARVGSIGYPIGPEPRLGVPYSMGVSTMKELLNKEFEKSWQEAPDNGRCSNCITAAFMVPSTGHLPILVIEYDDI